MEKRIQTAELAVQQAQESANSESKSSAGDKHETARSMSQLDSDMNARQAAEAKRELQAIQTINTDKLYSTFVNGAVAFCNNQIFFMFTGLGNASVGDQKIIFLSPQAPLSKALYGKQSGDEISFNGNKITISEIY